MIVSFTEMVFEEELDTHRFRRYERLVDDEFLRLQLDASRTRRALRRVANLNLSLNFHVDLSMGMFQATVLNILRELPNDRRIKRTALRLITKLEDITWALYMRLHMQSYMRLRRPHPLIPYVTRVGRHNRMLMHLDQYFLGVA